MDIRLPHLGNVESVHEKATNPTEHNLTLVAMALLILVLAALNVALIVQNHELKSEVGLPPTAFVPKAGMNLPEMHGTGLDGAKVDLSFIGQRKTLLFVFSPACEICETDWPSWNSLATSLDPKDVRIEYLNVGYRPDSQYVNEHNIRSSSYIAGIEGHYLKDHHLILTPASVLVDQDGTVLRVWMGFLGPRELQEIQERLSP